MFEKYSDALAGAGLLAISIAMYAVLPAAGETVLADVDLSFAPRIVAVLLGGLSLMLLLTGLYKASKITKTTGKKLFKYPGKLLSTVIVTTLAAIAFDTLGFKLTAMFYLFVEGYILSYEKGEFKLVRTAIIAVVAPFIIYYLFGTWLSMPLPEGIF